MNGKRPLTFNLFLLRLLSGIAGGIAGMLVAFIALFVISSFVSGGEGVDSLTFFAVIVIAFLATITANTITAVGLTFLDNQKYSRRKTIITQVFVFNLILFFLTIPIYLIGIPLELNMGILAMHFLLSAFISSLIMEVLAGYEYSLLGIYANALGNFISIGMALFVLNSTVSEQLLILLAMPMVWLILELVGGLTELIYDNFLRSYGVDALNIKTDLGGDALVEKELDEEDDDDDEDEETNDEV